MNVVPGGGGCFAILYMLGDITWIVSTDKNIKSILTIVLESFVLLSRYV